MSNIETHAIHEFKVAGFTNSEGKYSDEMQELICNNVLRLLEVFSEQGHSGFSANYALRMFEKLARFKPISPLTGEDEEWNEVSDGLDGKMYQNKRDSGVFKDKDGKATFLDAIIFWDWYTDPETREKSKLFFTGKGSKGVIEAFPWVRPDPIYMEYEE